MSTELINAFASGADEPLRWIAGLSDQELSARPVAGKWTMRQLVVHMLDGEMMMIGRIQRIIAEDNPLLMAFDENRFVERLAYDKADARQAATAFSLLRKLTAEMLRNQPPEVFSRTGVHSERGKLTLVDLVKIYAEHVPHHARHADDKRRALGKPV